MSEREDPDPPLYTPPRIRPQMTGDRVWSVPMVVAIGVVSLAALVAAVAIAYADRFAGR